MAFCSSCGTQMPAGATVCPACNRSITPVAGTIQTNVGGLTDNVAGALAYVTIIPAIVFLVLEPYKKNRFIRFHSFQCIFFAVAWTALWIVLSIIVNHFRDRFNDHVLLLMNRFAGLAIGWFGVAVFVLSRTWL